MAKRTTRSAQCPLCSPLSLSKMSAERRSNFKRTLFTIESDYRIIRSHHWKSEVEREFQIRKQRNLLTQVKVPLILLKKLSQRIAFLRYLHSPLLWNTLLVEMAFFKSIYELRKLSWYTVVVTLVKKFYFINQTLSACTKFFYYKVCQFFLV